MKSSIGGGLNLFDEDASSLLSNIRFSPQKGRILLGENRMLLIHASGFGILRRELIETIGAASARGLLTRMGYHNGAHDAQLVHNLDLHGLNTSSFILMGPQLHMLEGTGIVKEVKTEANVESGHFFGEYLWESSAEAQEHIKLYGLSQEPVCWMQIGYASGFVSSYMGKPILFREVECLGQGAEFCRIVGKPVDEWKEHEGDLQFFRADELSGGLSSASGRNEPQALLSESPPQFPLGIDGVVGVSAGFNAACHKLRQVAETQATVLFLGESGVGKEVFARSLHAISNRADKPFVAVNCAAIPDNLVESELFGVERGAYTGASSTRQGRFERAEGGTLFLDEIGILNMTAQGKLLRALQEREVERVGGNKVIKTDVRVVAATNLDLKEEVKAGRFREDLFYRLNVFPITVPALRDRLEDIPVFMNYFLHKYCKLHNRSVKGFTSRAITAMLSYKWPGNIRELENIIERGVIMASQDSVIEIHHLFSGGEILEMSDMTISPEGTLIATDHQNMQGTTEIERLSNKIAQLAKNESLPNEEISLDWMEKTLIDRALEACGGNKTAAARMLGLSRSQLYYRLNQSDKN